MDKSNQICYTYLMNESFPTATESIEDLEKKYEYQVFDLDRNLLHRIYADSETEFGDKFREKTGEPYRAELYPRNKLINNREND